MAKHPGRQLIEYNRFNAFVYQLTEFIGTFWPKFKRKPWVRKIRTYCFLDWCEWKAQLTMKDVDDQIDKYHERMDRDLSEEFNPVFEEEPGDGPLGGPMRLRASWKTEEDI